MTEEQERQLETLRVAMSTPERFSYNYLDAMREEGFLDTLTRVPPATPQHGGHYKAEATAAGHLVLTPAAERDLLRLRVEEFEAKEAVDRARRLVNASTFLDMEDRLPPSARTVALIAALDRANARPPLASKSYAEAVGKSDKEKEDVDTTTG